MPKRTRDSEVKVAKPVSALAARRQAQVPASAASPKPKARSAKDVVSDASSKDGVDAEKEETERIKKAREKIEKKLAQRVIEISAGVTESSVKIGNYGNSDSERAGEIEESALARLRRKRSKEELLRTGEDEDVEMISSDGNGFDEAVPLVEVSGSEGSIPQMVSVSNFTPTALNFSIEDTACTFRLRIRETLALVGEYQVAVVKGSITIYGAVISPDSGPQVVFAPTTHALPVIEATRTGSERESKRKPTQESEYDAEIVVSSHYSGLSDVGQLCPSFGGIWATAVATSEKITGATFHPVYTTTQPPSTISVLPAWQTLLTQLNTSTEHQNSRPTILICGSKGTGKSTLSRLLVNNLLAHFPSISYLDIDPGQPEFSPPGIVSLSVITTPILGPNYTHNTLSSAVRSHHTGYVSPRDDPAYYINAVLDLLAFHRDSFSSTPLIINSAGWAKGLGLELLQELLHNLRTPDVVFLGSPNPVGEILPAGTKLHELPAVPTEKTKLRYSPAELRMLATMIYFHSNSVGGWGFETPLTGIPPWTIATSGPEKGIEALCILDAQVSSEELGTAIEGTIVSILLVATSELPETEGSGNTGVVVLPTPPAVDRSETAGLAVVRSLDRQKRICQVIMPGCITEEVVEGWEKEGLAVVLVRGRLELPVWEMLMPDGATEVPWVSSEKGTEMGKGGAVWRIRRNVMRRGQQGGG